MGGKYNCTFLSLHQEELKQYLKKYKQRDQDLDKTVCECWISFHQIYIIWVCGKIACRRFHVQEKLSRKVQRAGKDSL